MQPWAQEEGRDYTSYTARLSAYTSESSGILAFSFLGMI